MKLLKLAIVLALYAGINLGFVNMASARLISAGSQSECEEQGGTWKDGKCHI